MKHDERISAFVACLEEVAKKHNVPPTGKLLPGMAKEIALLLNHRGIPTKKGQPWNSNLVSKRTYHYKEKKKKELMGAKTEDMQDAGSPSLRQELIGLIAIGRDTINKLNHICSLAERMLRHKEIS